MEFDKMKKVNLKSRFHHFIRIKKKPYKSKKIVSKERILKTLTKKPGNLFMIRTTHYQKYRRKWLMTLMKIWKN